MTDAIDTLAKMLRTSKESARTSFYFLRRRYGVRFGLIRLVRCAVAEAVKAQAEIDLENMELETD